MSATPQGVENHRRAILADIGKNRQEELAKELKQGGASAEDIASVVTPPPDTSAEDPKRPNDVSVDDWNAMSDEEKGQAIASAQLAPEAAPAEETPPAEEAPAAAAPEPKKLKGKVDGKEVEFDESAVLEAGLRALQKESTADKRLEEATRARDEAEKLRLRVEQTLVGSPPAAAPKSAQETIIAKDKLRGIVHKIQYGSLDEAEQALQEYGTEMAKLGQPNGLTLAELHQSLDLREAQQFVKTNYADVVGDENLKDLFVGKVNKKLAAGDTRPYLEICKETGDELRTWRTPAKQKPTPPADGSRAAAAERKRTTVSIPAAAARQPAASQDQPQAEKPLAQRVDEINRARGKST